MSARLGSAMSIDSGGRAVSAARKMVKPSPWTLERVIAGAPQGAVISSPLELIERGRRCVSGPDRKQAKHDRQDDVDAGEQRLAVAGEIERLQAERREGGVAAADARHDELARVRADEDASVRRGQGGEKADHKRAGDVDDQRADRKSLADVLCSEAR